MSRWLAGILCLALVLSVSVASAQDGAKKGRRPGGRGPGGAGAPGGRGGRMMEEMIKKFDKDGDGKLSDDERAEARKAMEGDFAKRREEMTKKYDKDGDGKLSDEEREAMRKEFGAQRGGQRPGGPGQRGGRRPGGEKPAEKPAEKKDA
jgi:hypothetical protein